VGASADYKLNDEGVRIVVGSRRPRLGIGQGWAEDWRCDELLPVTRAGGLLALKPRDYRLLGEIEDDQHTKDDLRSFTRDGKQT